MNQSNLAPYWHRSTKAERIGWLRREGHVTREEFSPGHDALVRVFHFDHIGFVAIGEVPGERKIQFARGVDLESAVRALAALLVGKVVLKGLKMFDFVRRDLEKYNTMGAKVEFVPKQFAAKIDGSAKPTAVSEGEGLREKFLLRRHDIALGTEDMVLNNAKLEPLHAKVCGGPLGSLDSIFEGLRLTKA